MGGPSRPRNFRSRYPYSRSLKPSLQLFTQLADLAQGWVQSEGGDRHATDRSSTVP
jgi:hypothetical protein